MPDDPIPQKHGFQWQIIPAYFWIVLGGLMILVSLVGIPMAAWELGSDRRLFPPYAIVGFMLLLVSAALCLFAGFASLKSRFELAYSVLLVAFTVGLAGICVLDPRVPDDPVYINRINLPHSARHPATILG